MFEYLHASPKLVATAGKILAEYSDPECHVHTPRLIFLTVENEDLITDLMAENLNISDDGVMSKTGTPVVSLQPLLLHRNLYNIINANTPHTLQW
jgi:hypothetical protein